MSFKGVADVEIVEKVSSKGYFYQVLRITFSNGKVIDVHCDAKEILKIVYAMNE